MSIKGYLKDYWLEIAQILAQGSTWGQIEVNFYDDMIKYTIDLQYLLWDSQKPP